MGDGLKKTWGVAEPAATGSDKQSQQFRAAFEKEVGVVNGHLQFTSANAEATPHQAFVGRRDALYPAFQSALGKIDRAVPAKAQADIDKVLGDAKALCGEVGTFRKAAEKAQKEWLARQTKYDAAVHQVEELEAWEDPKAAALRGLVDGIRGHVDERRFSVASTTLDQLLPKLKPIYDDYLKQKEAKPKYEQQFAEQNARLDALKAADKPSQPMTAKAAEADTALQEAKGKSDTKDFVGALAGVVLAKAAIDALDKLAKDPQRVKFLADRPAIEGLFDAPPDPVFASLNADWQALLQLREQSDPLAESGDYAGANKSIVDLKTKHDEIVKKHEKLKLEKDAYDALWLQVQPRLDQISQSRFASLATMVQDIERTRTEKEAAAQADDYAKALALTQNLSDMIDAYVTALTELEAKKQAFDTSVAGLQPQLADAAKPSYKSLAARQTELTTVKAQMEAAALKEDFAGATLIATDLETKLVAYQAELEKLKVAEAAYKAAWAPVQAKLTEALLSSRAFAALAAERAAITTAQAAVDAAVATDNFDNAAKLLPDLNTKVDAYLGKVKTKEDDIKKKSDEVTKQLDSASDATRGDVAKAAAKALTEEQVMGLPTPVRNRLLSEMQKGGLSDDEKGACKNLFSQKYLDPKFEKLDDANRQKLIEKMKLDPDFKKARDNWATMPESERVAVLKKAADYQAEVYGIGKTDVEAYSPKNPDGTLRRQRMGEYSDADGKLKVSREAMQDKGFDTVIDTVVHENAHRHQAALVKKLNTKPPGLKPGDPEYDQAMTFKLNDTQHGYYVQPKINSTDAATPDRGDEYFTQPQESHSRRTGEGVAAAGIGK